MYKTILLAIDLNDPKGSQHPTKFAIEHAKSTGAALHVVNVVPDLGMAIVGSYFTPDHNARVLEEASTALQNWAAEHTAEMSDVTLHVDQGSIYTQILAEAEKISADLIVVGAHKSQLSDYLIGPNAARISRHAKCSVLVVRS